MPIDVFVNFNGNCREAVEFYASVFGCEKPKMMTYGESPADPNYPLPDSANNLVIYTSLPINGSTVMFSDFPPGMPFAAGNNMSLVFGSKDKELIQTIFRKIKEGGTVDMELQETFWSKCYGMLTDKFGIQWQFSFDSGQMGE